MSRSLAIALLLLWPRSAAAQAPAPGIALSFEACATPWSQAVQRELAVELRDLAIDVGSDRTEALAVVDVVCDPSAPGRARLRVDDRVTDKHLERLVDEPSLSDAARAITVAIAIEELLRASWAEVALRGRDLSPPPEVAQAVEDALAPRASDVRHALGLRAHASYFTGDAFVAGGQLAWQMRVLERLVARVEIGAFATPSYATRLGAIDAIAVSATLAIGVSVLDPGPVHLDLGALAAAGVLVGRGRPIEDAVGRSEALGLVDVGGFVAIDVAPIDALALRFSIEAAAVALGAALETADGVVAGLSGARLGVGVGVDFWL